MKISTAIIIRRMRNIVCFVVLEYLYMSICLVDVIFLKCWNICLLMCFFRFVFRFVFRVLWNSV